VPPPVTRYAGAKEENRQKRIWFSFGVYVHTISWRRGQDRRRVILLLRWWKPRCWACIPVFLHPFLLTVYVYSSIYISTVKSAIDGVDIDVVRVCSAGKEVGGGDGTTEPAFFNFPGYEAQYVCVCLYTKERAHGLDVSRKVQKIKSEDSIYIYIYNISVTLCVCTLYVFGQV
jgi:hypothetical protein